MNHIRFLSVLFLSVFFGLTFAEFSSACPIEGSAVGAGTVSRVTLYRGQALITRRVKLEGAAGSQEVVISDLPLTIIDGSLYAESSEKVEVRAVRFRQRAVGEEPREEVRKLDEEIAAVNSAIALNQKKTELVSQKTLFIDQLQGFVAPTAQVELTKGVLDANTLRELTTFAFDQRTAIAEEQINLAADLLKLNEKLNLLSRSRSELTRNAQRTVNEAVLFVEKLDGGPQDLELNYLVSNCGWSPTYTIRAADDRKQVQIEYNALIQQVTGENWDGVQLTLSTASPTLSASGPSLAPFSVTLIGAEQTAQQAGNAEGGLAVRYAMNRAQQTEARDQLGAIVDFKAKTDANWSINKFACVGQELELVNPIEALSSIMVDDDTENAPSLSYKLDNNVSLASRNDQQMVRIFRGDLSSKFYHVATPLISTYVYREAEINNVSDLNFLAGPVAVYIDNRFVGRAEIPTVAQGEIFIVGFGSDAQLRTSRELVQKTEGVQGGNKEVKMKYRILVENYKNHEVNLRVFDRLPYTNRSSDIRISLGEPSVALSTDPVYLRRERSKNILRWDVTVPGETSGEKSFEIGYGLTLDYDRKYSIADASNDPNSVQDFQQLEKSRQKR